ncbi:MAG: hypothetical protein AAB152_12270 [Candidatus Coatesbacteria bacterium]
MSEGANHTIFENWVDRYLLPVLKDKPSAPAKLTKEDLWSARCGVLHEHSSRSDKTRRNKAVPIYYETRDRKESWIPWKMDRETAYCFVIEDLLDGLVDAVALFERTVEGDRTLEERVNAKGADMFAHSFNLRAVGGVFHVTGNRVKAEFRKATTGENQAKK